MKKTIQTNECRLRVPPKPKSNKDIVTLQDETAITNSRGRFDRDDDTTKKYKYFVNKITGETIKDESVLYDVR